MSGSVMNLLRCSRTAFTNISAKPFTPVVTQIAEYHRKPRDKVKLAARWAAYQKERKEAYEKHTPFKAITPLDDILTSLRNEHDAAQAKSDVVEVPQCGSHALTEAVSPFRKEQKKCIICQHNVELNYKNVRLLSQFVSPYTGRIYGASITGLCVPMQRRVAVLIKRAQRIGLLPVVQKDVRFIKDPELYNPFRPRV